MKQNNVLITGTSKGIGLKLAEYYLHRQFRVVGISRGESSLRHANYRHISVDLSSPTQVNTLLENWDSTQGDIHYLINNAGITSPNSLFLTSEQTIQRTFQINTLSPIEFIKFLSRHMQKNKFGRIVNITTTASSQNVSGQGPYISSKKALEVYSASVCDELAAFGITINNLAVSYFETDLNESLDQTKKTLALSQQKIKRACQIDDITNAIDFFFHDRSGFISGQTLKLAGL